MLLALNNVSFSFGARYILNEASWQINDGERIALVGPNGAGKSTVLRLIMGEYSYDEGSINKANDTTIGFFNQDLLSFSTDNSILSVAIGAFERAKEVEAKMDAITKELETKGDDEDLLMAYSEALHDFEIAGGYEMEHKSAEILEGLGFTTEQLQQPYSQFSGGWRMRVLLAKMMLQAPGILMLDEPTNHLDLPSIEWLEKYLISYPGTVIIVSHDRYFLDRMTTTTVELFMQKMHVYSGNYSFFQEEKATRLEFLEREFENQQKYIKQQERFIERFRAQATKAAQAQSAIKRLDKMDKIELPDGKVQRMNITFDVGIQPGKIIAEVHNLSKAYGENVILKNTKLELLRGDKVALVGANGKGKSTLLRILADAEPGYEGERSGGHNVQLSFYAQHQLESLKMENTILEEMMQCGAGKTELELRQLLGCFIFSGEDVFKKIKVLSGGEKARVALAKVIASRSNFLLLDEPTNHLDMQSVEMLIEALQQYDGTYVIVSHDRYFVSKTANQYWEIDNGDIKVFKGTYEEWEELKKNEIPVKAGKKNDKKSDKKLTTEPKKENNPVVQTVPKAGKKFVSKELQQAQKKVENLERKMKEAMDLKKELEAKLADPSIFGDYAKFQKIETDYKQAGNQEVQLHKELDTAIEAVIMLEG